MENHLQKTNQNLSTPLNEKEVEIAMVVWHVNQIVTFPLSDIQIEAWSRSINELQPDLDVNELTKAINLVKLGKIEWDSRIGLPNIFSALLQSRRYNDFGTKMVY